MLPLASAAVDSQAGVGGDAGGSCAVQHGSSTAAVQQGRVARIPIWPHHCNIATEAVASIAHARHRQQSAGTPTLFQVVDPACHHHHADVQHLVVAAQLLVQQATAATAAAGLDQRVELLQGSAGGRHVACQQVQRGAAEQLQHLLLWQQAQPPAFCQPLQLLHCSLWPLVGHAVLRQLEVEVGAPAGQRLPATAAGGVVGVAIRGPGAAGECNATVRAYR